MVHCLWPRSWEDSRTDLGSTFRMLTGRGAAAGSGTEWSLGRAGGGGGGGAGGAGGEDDAGSRSQLVRCSLTLEMQDESRVTKTSRTLELSFQKLFGDKKRDYSKDVQRLVQWVY